MPRGDNKQRDDYYVKRRSHKDPPRDKWPGREVTADDVELASGHKLDLLRQEDRLEAFESITAAHLRNYEDRSVVPHWKFTLLLGKMGEGKSTLATIFMARLYAGGWPVFHTGSLLFGRVLPANQVYTAVNLMPNNSGLFVDEAHVYMALGADNARPSVLLLQSLAGLRKANCELVLATAADDLLSRKVKREAHEVVAPFKPDVLPNYDVTPRAMRRRRLGLKPDGQAPRGSRLFRLGFSTIEDYPFAQDGILESYGLRDASEDPESHRVTQRMIPPRIVRQGLLLNDSFQQVPVGVQMTTHRQGIVDAQGDMLYGERPATSAEEAGVEPWEMALWVIKHRLSSYADYDRLTNGDLLELASDVEVGMTKTAFGAKVRGALGIARSNRGYKVGELRPALDRAFPQEAGA